MKIFMRIKRTTFGYFIRIEVREFIEDPLITLLGSHDRGLLIAGIILSAGILVGEYLL